MHLPVPATAFDPRDKAANNTGTARLLKSLWQCLLKAWKPGPRLEPVF